MRLNFVSRTEEIRVDCRATVYSERVYASTDATLHFYSSPQTVPLQSTAILGPLTNTICALTHKQMKRVLFRGKNNKDDNIRIEHQSVK